MGRTPVTVKVDEERVEMIDAEADDLDISRSEYIRDILKNRHAVEDVAEQLDHLVQNEASLREEIEAEVRAEFERRYQHTLEQKDETIRELKERIARLETKVETKEELYDAIVAEIREQLEAQMKEEYEDRIAELKQERNRWKNEYNEARRKLNEATVNEYENLAEAVRTMNRNVQDLLTTIRNNRSSRSKLGRIRDRLPLL